MKIKKSSLLIISLAVATNFLFVNNDVLEANSKAGYNILDYVYTDIIPGKNVLTFTLKNSEEMITGPYVKSELKKVGIDVIGNLPDIICTGTKIQTNYNNNKIFTALIYGDVDSNGAVDFMDSQAILLHDVFGGSKELKDVNLIAGNVYNSDTDTDFMDSQRVLRFSVDIESKLVLNERPLNTDKVKPVITLNGINETIEVGSKYTDKGVIAIDDKDGNITSKVKTVNSVDTSKVGIYTVTYNVTDARGNVASQVTRTVKVVDTTIPVITLKGDKDITIQAGSIYSDLGALATDNYDGDITNKIIVVNPVDTKILGKYTVTYNVLDTSNNVATEVTRTVNVIDTTAPIISLNGDSEITIETGSAYIDAKAVAKDNYDAEKVIVGTIYKNGIEVSDVDISTVGDYVIKYNTKDSQNNTSAEVTRIVHVRKAVTFIDYIDNNIQTLNLYTNTDNTLINTIKINSDEITYNVSDLKSYVTLNGKVLSSNEIDVRYVKNGDSIDIYCDTKNEVGEISIIPYLGDSYDATKVQGISLLVRVTSNVTSVKVNKVEDRPYLKKIDFYNGTKIVDVMNSDVLINPTEADILSMKDGQIAIKTTGNLKIEKKTIDENTNIIVSTSDKSKVKYFEILSLDGINEATGTIQILVANNIDSTLDMTVEKSVLKDIKLPYKDISFNLSDVEDMTIDKIKNREVIKKIDEYNDVYVLIPIEFFNTISEKYNVNVGNVEMVAGEFDSGLIADKLTFASNNPNAECLTKLFAVVNNDIIEVTNPSANFDYIGFWFTENIENTEITISYGDITDSTQIGFVQSQSFWINKTK